MAAPSADQADYESIVRSLSTAAPSGLDPKAHALLRRRELQLACTCGQLLVLAAWRQALALQRRRPFVLCLLGHGQVACRAASLLACVIDPRSIHVVGPRAPQSEPMRALGVHLHASIAEAGRPSMVVLTCQPIQCMEVARSLRHQLPAEAVFVSLVAATPHTKLRTLFAHPCPLVLHGGPPVRDQGREEEDFRVVDTFSPSWLRRERADVLASAADQETGRAAAAVPTGSSQRAPSRRSGAEIERLAARAEGLRRGFERLITFGLSRCDLDWTERCCEAMAYAAWAGTGDCDTALAACIEALSATMTPPARPARGGRRGLNFAAMPTPTPTPASAPTAASDGAHAQLAAARRWAASRAEPLEEDAGGRDHAAADDDSGRGPAVPAAAQSAAASLCQLFSAGTWEPPTESRRGVRPGDRGVSAIAGAWASPLAHAVAVVATSDLEGIMRPRSGHAVRGK